MTTRPGTITDTKTFYVFFFFFSLSFFSSFALDLLMFFLYPEGSLVQQLRETSSQLLENHAFYPRETVNCSLPGLNRTVQLANSPFSRLALVA